MAFSNILRQGVNLTRIIGNQLMPNRIFRPLSNSLPALNKKTEVEITFIKYDGTRIKTKGKIGESLLDVVVNNSLDLDGFGACEGTLTCSTCHVVLKEDDYKSLPNQPESEECDMLELAHSCTDTSRLGCQIILTESLNGLEIQVPECPNDLRLD